MSRKLNRSSPFLVGVHVSRSLLGHQLCHPLGLVPLPIAHAWPELWVDQLSRLHGLQQTDGEKEHMKKIIRWRILHMYRVPQKQIHTLNWHFVTTNQTFDLNQATVCDPMRPVDTKSECIHWKWTALSAVPGPESITHYSLGYFCAMSVWEQVVKKQNSVCKFYNTEKLHSFLNPPTFQ